MDSVLGFRLDAWDYATFAAMAIVGAGFLGLLALFLGLPGRIAIARHHPEAKYVRDGQPVEIALARSIHEAGNCGGALNSGRAGR
jgi:hypothetical protein